MKKSNKIKDLDQFADDNITPTEEDENTTEDIYEADIFEEFLEEPENESPSERKKNLKKEFYVKRS